MSKTITKTETPFDFAAKYRVRGWSGIAFHALKYATKRGRYDEDAEDYEEVEDRSQVVVVMIGDDRLYTVDVEDCTPLNESEYCRVCGQIGCNCNY